MALMTWFSIKVDKEANFYIITEKIVIGSQAIMDGEVQRTRESGSQQAGMYIRVRND
ncbi:hypothetical protein DPMN_161161 [Dreissena polymorpha]|uniref:Uncharacterized protein n=1 Tax=Dreissena polymorpha TaxID=45954 RepID=A0A9D4IT78_DREPO|nr:hypothetical protein DPMN_161161 [Dreissena polymorpha]